MSAPGWLVAKPIAHRGLHGGTAGLIENTCGAALAAITAHCAIECDVQLSRDGEAFVFHDESLERLTGRSGLLGDLDAREVESVPISRSDEFIPSLQAFIACVNGRTPLIIEIKSAFDGDMRLAERTAEIVAQTNGPIALKSFDPEIMAHLRAHRARLGLERTPLGMVAEARFDPHEWPELDPEIGRRLAQFLHWPQTRPEFLSWCVRDLPHAVPLLLREGLGVPVMAWTVRSPPDWEIARRWADQAVFEGEPGG